MAEPAGKYFHTPLVVSYLGIMMLLPLLIVSLYLLVVASDDREKS